MNLEASKDPEFDIYVNQQLHLARQAIADLPVDRDSALAYEVGPGLLLGGFITERWEENHNTPQWRRIFARAATTGEERQTGK